MKRNLLAVAMLAALSFTATAPFGAPADGGAPPKAGETFVRLQAVRGSASEYELLVYGDIGESWWGESVTAQSVVKQLNELADTVSTINVRINSYGGSVADGLAIYNALKRHKATKAVTVDGVAMSAASLIAMAGDTVTMPSTSLLMIHAPWGGVWGNAKECRQYADVLDKFSDSMADAYAARSGMDRAAVLLLLTDGEDHYYTGDEAVEAGFATNVADAADDSADDESARGFASERFERIAARAPAKYSALIAAAASRRPPHFAAAPTGAGAHPSKPAVSGSTQPPAVAGNPTGATTVTEEEKKAARAAALKADQERRAAIRARFAPFTSRDNNAALQSLRQECEDDVEMTVENASAKLLDFMGKDTTPLGSSPRIEAGQQQEANTYREGAILALQHRYNPGANALDERARRFRGMNLLDMARDAVARTGRSTEGMSRQELAVYAMQSTSDFPNVMEGLVTRTLRAGYEASVRTFTPWARKATLPDFKLISRVQIAGAPNLLKVPEGAEYEFGTIGDGSEKYRVQKYGRIVAVTWETIINDDLDAITRTPFAFGASAADLESDIVYGVLTGNANMADGVPLFHASHNNLGTPAALIDAIHPNPATANPLSQMRQKMILQKGLEGRYISVRPRYLLVPPSLEEAALKVTNAAILAARANDLNVTGPTLAPIVEPRLEDSSATAWYGASENSTVDTIEYGYLEGHEAVFTETRHGFEVDGVQIKCRHVFGAKAIDHRGLFKNAGAAPTAVT